MKNALAFVLTLFVTFTSLAASAHQIKPLEASDYNPETGILTVWLTFDGTNVADHQLTYEMEPCDLRSKPHGLAVRISDSAFDDTGTDLLVKSIEIDLKNSQCLPALVTVRAFDSHSSLYIE